MTLPSTASHAKWRILGWFTLAEDHPYYLNIWIYTCFPCSFVYVHSLVFFFFQNPFNVLFNVSVVPVFISLYVTIVIMCFVYKNMLSLVCVETYFSVSFTYCHVNQTTLLYCQSSILSAEFAGKNPFYIYFTWVVT